MKLIVAVLLLVFLLPSIIDGRSTEKENLSEFDHLADNSTQCKICVWFMENVEQMLQENKTADEIIDEGTSKLCPLLEESDLITYVSIFP